ncbi:MAG: PKD domain-containing protein [Thermoplasmata archaeon]
MLQPVWTNETSNVSSFEGYLGAVAYDPLLGTGALIYYGGCTPTECPSNSTWAFAGLGWANISYAFPITPGPIEGQAMDFDPVWGGIISAGGYDAGGSAPGVWLLNASGWFNITTATGSVPSAYFGAMAWDPALQALVYVDGCVIGSSCTEFWTETWELTSTWSFPDLGPGGLAWGLSGASLAYDPTDQALLLFGGYNGESDVNYTFEFGSGGWTNLTTTSAGCNSVTLACGYYPTARAYGQMTWDGEIGAILLFGGFNSTTTGVDGDSWQFQDGSWLPTYSYYSGSLPVALCEGAMAVNSTDVAPMLVGGITAAFEFGAASYVYEVAPNLTLRISPNPTDVGAMISINVTVQPGTGSGPWEEALIEVNGTSYLDSDRYGINFTTSWAFGPAAFELTTPGTYPVVVTVLDWVYGVGTAYGNITVTPTLLVHASANESTTEVGLPLSFTGSATGGSGTYSTYAWNFGDGHTANTASSSHTFAATGTYHVRLNVTDSDGITNSTNLTVQVLTLLDASAITASPTSPAAGTSVTFGVTVSGGDTPYTTYAWSFGDGTTGTGATPTHSYSAGGTFAVNVTVTDSLGVKSTAHLSVTASAPPSSSGGFSLTSGTGLYLLLGVVVVIVVVAALLLMRRKKPASIGVPPAAAGTGVPAGAGGPPPPPPA